MAYDPDQRAEAARCTAKIFAMRAMPPTPDQLTTYFNHFLTLIAGDAVTLTIVPGPEAVDQSDPTKTAPVKYNQKGNTLQLADNQKCPLSVQETDTKGFPVNAGQITYSVDDTSVATVADAGDGTGPFLVAGNPGSTLLHATDGTLSGSLAVDVTSGQAAALQISAGAPVAQ